VLSGWRGAIATVASATIARRAAGGAQNFLGLECVGSTLVPPRDPRSQKSAARWNALSDCLDPKINNQHAVRRSYDNIDVEFSFSIFSISSTNIRNSAGRRPFWQRLERPIGVAAGDFEDGQCRSA